MARPKKNAHKPSARGTIAAAFWRQLSVMLFSQMTARGVAAEAGVNHNTFYRHFDSIEDLA